MEQLYKLEVKDINQCAENIARAFYDYPMFQYVFGEQNNLENIQTVLRFLMKYSVLYGEAYAFSKDLSGVILYSDFKDYRFTFFRSLKSGLLQLLKMGSEAGNRFNAFDAFTLKTHKKLVQRPHQYIILVGVNPDQQGQGYGNMMLQHVLQVAEEKGQACYLETHGEKNVAYYKKFGFKVLSEDIVPGSEILQYAMIKD